jgi:hypothetical protein
MWFPERPACAARWTTDLRTENPAADLERNSPPDFGGRAPDEPGILAPLSPARAVSGRNYCSYRLVQLRAPLRSRSVHVSERDPVPAEESHRRVAVAIQAHAHRKSIIGEWLKGLRRRQPLDGAAMRLAGREADCVGDVDRRELATGDTNEGVALSVVHAHLGAEQLDPSVGGCVEVLTVEDMSVAQLVAAFPHDVPRDLMTVGVAKLGRRDAARQGDTTPDESCSDRVAVTQINELRRDVPDRLPDRSAYEDARDND